jgi:tetratricopeptide (TPR) repeat protein
MGLNTLGLHELKRGHFSEAEKDFTRMAEINRAVYDDRHYLVGIALLNLGEVYLQEKSYTRAEQSLRQALERLTEKLPAGHSNTAIAQVKLGHTLVLEKQYKDAESHLLAGYDVLAKQPGPATLHLQTARKDLVAVYEALHQPEQAKKFRADSAAATQAGQTSSQAKR